MGTNVGSTWARPLGLSLAPADVTERLLGLSGGGQPMAPDEQAAFGRQFGHDFSGIRIHTGDQAAQVTGALGARALTAGEEIVLSPAAAAPGGPDRGTLLAHELTHVVQQRRSAGHPWIQRQPLGTQLAPAARQALKPGDDVEVEVYAVPGEAEPYGSYSGHFRLDAQGSLVMGPGGASATVQVAGFAPGVAAQTIANQLVTAQLFRGPRVCLKGPGMTTPACGEAKTAMPPDVARAYLAFKAYIEGTRTPADAVARYHQWISDHLNQPDFTKVSPPDLWAESLKQPARPADPQAERAQVWQRFIASRQAESAALTGRDREVAVEAMRAFLDWYEAHQGKPDFARADPAEVYARLWVARLRVRTEADARAKLAAQREAVASSPEALEAIGAKFDEFLAKAMQLWGYSSRTYPYVIPVDSEGKDILVTGSPELQKVLDGLGGELVRWATAHMHDPNYASVSVNSVLLDLLQGGFSERIAEAQARPLAHETIDRNELLPGRVAAAFGETVAKGLLAIAVVGLFVGAEVITAGQATWLLAGVAAYSGVSSYSARRDEIEKSGYDVPVPASMVHAAGDVVGVSQLVEGITGERLGTDVPLGSEARSTQAGAGAGNVATLLLGSRAYRGGQRIGQSARLSRPGLKPPGPDANIPARPIPERPAAPVVSPAMGPVEAAARAALPEHLRPGLDLWTAEIRQNGHNPETVLQRLGPEKITQQARVFLERYEAATAKVDVAARRAQRATDDPLRPQLRHNVPVKGSRVVLHYDNAPPKEVGQAVEVAARTGEEVHLFGDTASGQQYPGIDGTIGTPPRPLSLKAAVPAARANLARKMASDALTAAKDSGYSHVEVHIDMPGSTVQQVQAAWDAAPLLSTDPIPGPAFEGSVVAKVVVRCSDGVWTQTPPLAGRPLTGVSPAPAGPDPREKR